MFKKSLLVAGIGMALSITAQADYQFEAQGTAGRTNIDVGRDDGDVDVFNVGGSFYFQPVDTSKGPLGEAAFLDHSSSVSAGYRYTDVDDIIEDLDGDTYGISGRYVLDLDALPLIFEGSWQRQTPDFSDIDTYSLGFGAYLTDTTTAVISYTTTDVDETNAIDPGDVDKYDITLEHLWALPQGALKLRGHYGIIDVDNNDDIDAWELAGTYYINDNIGIGTGYGRFDNYGLEEDTFSIHGEWFVNEQIGLSLEYAYSEIDNTDIESDSVVLGARIRF